MRFFLLTALLLCVAPGCDRTPTLSPLPPDGVILAFGDSLTFGTGASPGESYPAILQQLSGMTVINGGRPGEISAGGRERLPELLVRADPELLILCHGGNDLLRRLDPKNTRENLRAMITAARGTGAEVVLVAVPQPGLWLHPPDFYRSLCEEENLPCDLETLPHILGERQLKSDTIHPNEDGYARLAASLHRLLQRHGAL